MCTGDISYRRGENCETAVNKGHHNIGSCPVRCCDFFANDFSPLIWLISALVVFIISRLWQVL